MSQTVTTLLLKDVRFDCLDVLRDLRAVTYACLTGDYDKVDDTPFYDSLCDAADPMWPRLRHLELWGIESTVNSVDRDGLLNVVRARNGQRDSETGDGNALPPPLEKLEIDDQSAPGWVAMQVKEIMGDKCIIHIRE
ncbi:hypothetical protein EXIGLDRAFT_776113 [Exidia glandulosa HHB12029]|uniref:Uncharacterized protein n=1 Tax=Exidia glandulosa HHB12029 TaxID=1314781 RepID=A0A165DLW9_EXIGL|nr:hypothetical protein EXIGLDRAFT_776113 [Exidia glandulosa HHB12029]